MGSKEGEQNCEKLIFKHKFDGEENLVEAFKGKDMEIPKFTYFQMIKMQLLEIPFQSPVINIICINYILVVSFWMGTIL